MGNPEPLWALLPLVASTLEIRKVFLRVSAIAREAVPHDALGIQVFQRERGMIASYVVAERLLGQWEYPILPDVDDVALDVIVDDVEIDGTGAVMKGRLRLDGAEKEVLLRADSHRSRIMREWTS